MDLLGDRIIEQAAHLDAAMQRLLADIRTFDASGAWAREGMSSCAHWLSWRVAWGLAMARDRVRVARALGEFPATEACLAKGELSYSRVRAVLRVATPANESMLLEVARLTTAVQMEQVARTYAGVQAHDKESNPRDDRERRHVRRRTTVDGMIKIEATLHPDEAEMVWAMLDHAAKQSARVTAVTEPVVIADLGGGAVTAVTEPVVTADPGNDRVTAVTKREFDRADALMMITQTYLRGGRLNRSPVEVTVTIATDALRVADGEEAEIGCMRDTAIDRQAARRLSCDAGVVEVHEDEHGMPLSVGRKRRTISGAIKRALLKRDTACTFPGCTNHVYLEGHHIQHWADGGETTLENMVVLCTHHHRFVHEYRYAIELGEDGRPRFRDPHGTLVTAVMPRVMPANLGWPAIRAANADLPISANTIPFWDGSPVSYHRVVGHLAFADGLR